MRRWVQVGAVMVWAVRAAAGEEPAPRPVSLVECVRAAVERSLPLEIERLGRAQAALEPTRARGTFWPVFFFDMGIQDERTPGVGTEPGETTDRFSYDGGVEVMTELGTEVSAALTNSRRGTSDPGAALDPEHRARLELQVTQPVLKGFGREVVTADLERARLGYRAALERFRDRLNQLVHDVELAYWDLTFAQQDVAIKERSRKRAQQQFEDTQENIRRGLLPRHDIYVVEENVVSFDRQYQKALNAQASARAVLAELLQEDAEEAALVATDAPVPELVSEPAQADLVAAGWLQNPILRADRAQAMAAGIVLKVERNNRLPALDLQASLALNGVTDDLGSTWEQLGSATNHEVFLGVNLRLPLFDLLDDSRQVQAELEVRKTLLKIREDEQALAFEIDNHWRDIRHLQESHRLSCRVSELARLKLEAQQEKYRAGIAALKDLVQFLRELDEAEIEQARTLVALVKKAADLHLAVGDLHRLRGVGVQ
jgi:outer membrane protein